MGSADQEGLSRGLPACLGDDPVHHLHPGLQLPPAGLRHGGGAGVVARALKAYFIVRLVNHFGLVLFLCFSGEFGNTFMQLLASFHGSGLR